MWPIYYLNVFFFFMRTNNTLLIIIIIVKREDKRVKIQCNKNVIFSLPFR